MIRLSLLGQQPKTNTQTRKKKQKSAFLICIGSVILTHLIDAIVVYSLHLVKQ
jgi:hypothetical protein